MFTESGNDEFFQVWFYVLYIPTLPPAGDKFTKIWRNLQTVKWKERNCEK